MQSRRRGNILRDVMTRYVRTRNERDRKRLLKYFAIIFGEESHFSSKAGQGYRLEWPDVNTQIFIFYID